MNKKIESNVVGSIVSLLMLISPAYADVTAVVLEDNGATSTTKFEDTYDYSMFGDNGVYEDAIEIFELMRDGSKDKQVDTSHLFSSYAEGLKARQCLFYEILNGRCDLSSYSVKNSDGRVLGWQFREETMRQHDLGTSYIDKIWQEHGAVIEFLPTQLEKASYIANIIVDKYIEAYDDSYKNATISDMVESNNYRGTCLVYTTLFDRLCERAGIDAYVEVGYYKNGDLHAWNKLVFADGHIGYYDLTVYRLRKNKWYLDMKESDKFYQDRYTELVYDAENGFDVGYALINNA